MVDTLPSDVPPDGYAVKYAIELWNAEFGDGYSQRAAKGINNVKGGIPFKWSNLTEDEMVVLKTFFLAHSAGEAWYYTLPDEDDPRKYTLLDFEIVYEGADTYQVSANAKEVFDV